MSTLNNPREILTDVLIRRQKVQPAVAAETGLDLELLQAVLEQLKPRLDYMRGFKPWSSWRTTPDPSIDGKLRVILLKRWRMINTKGRMISGLEIYLTREGNLLVDTEGAAWSRGTASKALELLSFGVEPGYEIVQATGDGAVKVESAALSLAYSLYGKFRESVDTKARDVESEREVLSNLDDMLYPFTSP
jgi:hypothetical protein